MKCLQKEIWEETGTPWGVLVGCILLNQAQYWPARSAWDEMKQVYSRPKSFWHADHADLASYMQGLGMQNVRARSLKRMSKQYKEGHNEVTDYYGIGRFGQQAWNLLVLNDLDTPIEDHYLERYRNWLNST